MKVEKEYGKAPVSCCALCYVGSQMPAKGLEDDGVSFTSSLTEPMQPSALQDSRSLGQSTEVSYVLGQAHDARAVT